MYGNKVIGVMNSKIDIHGTKRDVTWTYLKSTIKPGDTTFSLEKDVDWKVGESIVVASTSFEIFEAEQKVILSIASGVFTVDSPFVYQHYSDVETYGTSKFPMKAEVALLSRNILFKGADIDSIPTNYGAHIMLMGSELMGTVGQFSHFELT